VEGVLVVETPVVDVTEKVINAAPVGPRPEDDDLWALEWKAGRFQSSIRDDAPVFPLLSDSLVWPTSAAQLAVVDD
jgi:hypothetical protein